MILAIKIHCRPTDLTSLEADMVGFLNLPFELRLQVYEDWLSTHHARILVVADMESMAKCHPLLKAEVFAFVLKARPTKANFCTPEQLESLASMSGLASSVTNIELNLTVPGHSKPGEKSGNLLTQVLSHFPDTRSITFWTSHGSKEQFFQIFTAIKKHIRDNNQLSLLECIKIRDYWLETSVWSTGTKTVQCRRPRQGRAKVYRAQMAGL